MGVTNARNLQMQSLNTQLLLNPRNSHFSKGMLLYGMTELVVRGVCYSDWKYASTC